MTTKLGDLLPKPGAPGETWTRSEQASWEAAGSPAPDTYAYAEWLHASATTEEDFAAADLALALRSADKGGNIAALLEQGFKPGERNHTYYKFVSTNTLNAAKTRFQEQNGPITGSGGFIEEKLLIDPEASINFLENTYAIAESSFEGQVYTRLANGEIDVAESIGGNPLPALPAFMFPTPTAILAASGSQIAAAIAAVQGTSLAQYKEKEWTPRLSEKPFEWWNTPVYEPWVDTDYNTYNIAITADGKQTLPYFSDSVGLATAAATINIDAYLRGTVDIKPGPNVTPETYEELLFKGINEELRLDPPQMPPVDFIKMAAVDKLLQYFDKQGIGNFDVVDALANKAVVSDYAPGPRGAVFKVTIHRVYIDMIDKNIRDKFAYETLFGHGSYYNYFWEQDIWLTIFQKNLANFKQTMTELDAELRGWKAQGNITEPEDFSFSQEYDNFEAFIKVNQKSDTKLGGAVGNYMRENEVGSAPPIQLKIVYDDKYLLKGLTAVNKDFSEMPLFVGFERFANLPASSAKNVSYLANMSSIVDAQRNKKGFVSIAKQYIVPRPKFIEFMEAEESPGIKSFQELQREDKMLQDPIIRSQVYERAKKRKYNPGDPTFTFLDRTVEHITSIGGAYDVFLNRYGLEWVAKQILECLMNIVGLGFTCETRLQMVLEHLGVEEFRAKVLVPYTQWASSVGGQVVSSYMNTYTGVGQTINQLARFKEEDYYFNLYLLENPPPEQTPEDRRLLLLANKELAQEIQGLRDTQKDYRNHAGAFVDSAQYFERLSDVFTIDELCEVLRELLDAIIEFLTNPEFTLSDFKFPRLVPTLDLPEKFPTINLFEAIARVAEEAVWTALEQIAVKATLKILGLISKICNDLKLTVNVGWPFDEDFIPSDNPSIPLSKDDLRNLLNDLFGDTETPASLMGPLNELLGAFDGETDLVTALENILDQITSQISSAELCQLIGGTAGIELLRKVKAAFDEVPVLKNTFTDTDRIAQFFKAAGQLVSPDFCDALLNIDDAMIEDLCDLPPGTLFDAWQQQNSAAGGPGSGGTSADQLRDELKDLMDELAKQLANDGNHNDAVAPLIDECTPPPPAPGEPAAPGAPPPVVDWKRVPVIENANNVAIDTFYHDVNARWSHGAPQLLKALTSPELVVNYDPNGPVEDGVPITWTNHVQRVYMFTHEDDAWVEQMFQLYRDGIEEKANEFVRFGGPWWPPIMPAGHTTVTNDNASATPADRLTPTDADRNALAAAGVDQELITEHIRKWLAWSKMDEVRNSAGDTFVQMGLPGQLPPSMANGGLSALMSLVGWSTMIEKVRENFPPGIVAPPVRTIQTRPGNAGPYTILDLASTFLSLVPGLDGSIIEFPSHLDYGSRLEGQTIIYTVTSPRAEGLVPIDKFRNLAAGNARFSLYEAVGYGVGEGIPYSSELQTNRTTLASTLDFKYPAKDFVNTLSNKAKDGFRPNAGLINPTISGLRINSSPHVSVLDLVDDANEYDAFQLKYERTVTAEQHRVDGQRQAFGVPGSLTAVEKYETVYQDYYKDPRASSLSKTLLFIDFLGDAIKRHIPTEVDPVAAAQAGHGEEVGALYTRAVSGMMGNVFQNMIFSTNGAPNPFFASPAELSSLEVIPSSNQRVQRARGVVPVEVQAPDNSVSRVFVKMGSKEANEIAALPGYDGPDIGASAPRGDLLSLDTIKEKVKNDFLSSPFCEDPDDPFANKDLSQLETAAMAGVVYLILRVYTLEFLLKIAPVLVNFRISDMFKSNVVPLYIVQNLKSDISQDDVYYCEFKKGVDKIIGDMGKSGESFRDPVMDVEIDLSDAAAFEEKLVFLLKNQVLELEREYNYIIDSHKKARQRAHAGVMPPEWEGVHHKSIAESIVDFTQAGVSIHDVPPSYFYRPAQFDDAYEPAVGTFYFERYMRVVDNENPEGLWGTALKERRGGADSRRNSGRIVPPGAMAGHFGNATREQFFDFVGNADLQDVVNYNAWQKFMELGGIAAAGGGPQGTTVGGYFNKLAYGVRLVYVARDDEDLSTIQSLFPDLQPTEHGQLTNAGTRSAIREKAFLVTEVGDPDLERLSHGQEGQNRLASSTFRRIVIPLASQEMEIPLDFEWTHEVRDVERYRHQLPNGDTLWETLQQQVIDGEDYKRLMEYIMAADRVFGTSFIFAESFVSNKYYKTDKAFKGLKAALRLLYLLMIDESPFGNKAGRCDSDWGISLTGIDWESLLDDMGFSAIDVVFDTILAALLAILQLAGSMLDPFGLMKLILCPVIPTDGTFGGLGNRIKKEWDCPDFPSLPPWPEFDDNSCDPTSNKEIDEECKVEVPDYFSVE